MSLDGCALMHLGGCRKRSEFLDALESDDVSAAAGLIVRRGQQGTRNLRNIEMMGPTSTAETETSVSTVGGVETGMLTFVKSCPMHFLSTYQNYTGVSAFKNGSYVLLSEVVKILEPRNSS